MPGWASLPAQLGVLNQLQRGRRKGTDSGTAAPLESLSPGERDLPSTALSLRGGLEVTLAAATLPSGEAGLGYPKPGRARSWQMLSVGTADSDQGCAFCLGLGLPMSG